jgi:hypothetical protein
MDERGESRRPPAGDLAEARERLDALEPLTAAQEREHKRLCARLELFRRRPSARRRRTAACSAW